jgi:hypothetical protein
MGVEHIEGIPVSIGDDGINYFSIPKDKISLIPVAKKLVEKAKCYHYQDSTFAVHFYYSNTKKFTINDEGNFEYDD